MDLEGVFGLVCWFVGLVGGREYSISAAEAQLSPWVVGFVLSSWHGSVMDVVLSPILRDRGGRSLSLSLPVEGRKEEIK